MAEEDEKRIVFPARLRTEVDGGAAFVRFKTKNGDDIGSSVHLFVPQGFSMPDAANYGTMDLGILGGLESTGGDLTTVTEADIKGQATSIGALVGSFVNAGGQSAALGGMAALRKGLASNPFTETQYNNSNIRSFGFTFKLISESEEEADTALEIEHYFRENMYPEKSGAFTLKYPNRFSIEFYNGSEINKYMPFINECYLVSLNTTYNATGNAFHTKGQPVEVDIALTFQETKALTRSGLYKGGDGSSKTAEEKGDE
tara:strand:- start:2306 stop:3079 length:774 start_codon:yes stop_codon:yes gene_type:complete